MNFGTLDYMVFTFLKRKLSVDDYARVRTLHLKDRLARMERLLSEDDCSGTTARRFEEICGKLDEVRELRNHLAHGHMCQVWDDESGKYLSVLLKAKDVDYELSEETDRIDFDTIRLGLEKLDELVDIFSSLAGFGSKVGTLK